jgi:hypothetical protein
MLKKSNLEEQTHSAIVTREVLKTKSNSGVAQHNIPSLDAVNIRQHDDGGKLPGAAVNGSE